MAKKRQENTVFSKWPQGKKCRTESVSKRVQEQALRCRSVARLSKHR